MKFPLHSVKRNPFPRPGTTRHNLFTAWTEVGMEIVIKIAPRVAISTIPLLRVPGMRDHLPSRVSGNEPRKVLTFWGCWQMGKEPWQPRFSSPLPISSSPKEIRLGSPSQSVSSHIIVFQQQIKRIKLLMKLHWICWTVFAENQGRVLKMSKQFIFISFCTKRFLTSLKYVLLKKLT